jgi:uncharacterized protein YdaU (DUF1376 family)
VNFYKHYIGDFQRDTGHMSLTQRGAYLCLMHHYYATEKPLPNDHAALCRIAGAIDKAEREAVRVVMGIFEAVDSGLMHKRIEAELQKAGAVADTNRGIALAREAARRAAKEARTEHEACTKRGQSVPRNENERSTNQTPDTNTNTPPPPKGGADPAGFAEFWNSWPASVRKVGRKQCATKWKRHGFNAQLPAIVAHVEAMKQSKQWRDGFEPAPLTYLNQERWGDGLPSEAESPSEAGFI